MNRTTITIAMQKHGLSQEVIKSIFWEADILRLEALRKNSEFRNDLSLCQSKGAIRARRHRNKKSEFTLNAAISMNATNKIKVRSKNLS